MQFRMMFLIKGKRKLRVQSCLKGCCYWCYFQYNNIFGIRIKISTQDDETLISITANNPSELDHTKIVSEVLKKYPDLMKQNRNLKLKIIPANKPDSQPVKNSKENTVVKLPTVSLVKKSNWHSLIFLRPLWKQQSSTVEQASSKETPSTSKEMSTRKTNFINSVANKKKPVNPLFKSLGEEGPWTCLECASKCWHQ